MIDLMGLSRDSIVFNSKDELVDAILSLNKLGFLTTEKHALAYKGNATHSMVDRLSDAMKVEDMLGDGECVCISSEVDGEFVDLRGTNAFFTALACELYDCESTESRTASGSVVVHAYVFITSSVYQAKIDEMELNATIEIMNGG